MKWLLVSLLLISSLVLAGYTVEKAGSNLVIKFDHYPVFNVSVHFESINGRVGSLRLYKLQKSLTVTASRITSVSYDNSTWIKLVNKTQKNGELVLTGETEDASNCLHGKRTGRDPGFWSKPENCYTTVIAKLNGKEVKRIFASEGGNWSMKIQLVPGDNEIEVIAQDPGKNTAEKKFTVNWKPSSKSLLEYYISKPEVQIGIGVFVFILFVGLVLFIRGERARKRRTEEINKRLSQLFEEETVEIRRHGQDLISATQSPELRAKIKAVLLADPFYTYVKKSVKKYNLVKGDSEKLKSWVDKEFMPGLKRLLRDYDPNVRLFASNYFVIESVYKQVAMDVLKELASR